MTATINHRAWGLWAQHVGETVTVTAQAPNRRASRVVGVVTAGKAVWLPTSWLTTTETETA